MESQARVADSAMHALKQQIEYFKNKAKDGEKHQDEIIRLKRKLDDLKSLQMVLSGTRDEVTDMVRHNRDPDSLGVLVTALKK